LATWKFLLEAWIGCSLLVTQSVRMGRYHAERGNEVRFTHPIGWFKAG